MHRNIAFAAGLATVVALGAAPALAKDKPAAKPSQCFFTREADGFAAPDDQTLYVRVGVHDVYQFEMFGHCPDMDWNQGIALVSKPGSTICTGMDAEVISHATGLGPQRCPVRSTRKLTPEEVAALPKKSRP